jgi:tetratricopeptide (TPR) repeat protein
VYRICRSSNSITATAFAAGNLGRVASRSGRAADAMLWLEEARDLFEQAGDRGQVLETEARIGEALALQGAWQDALSSVERTLQEATAVDGVAIQEPMLHRVRAMALIGAGRLEEARDALELSLELGRAREATYEVGLTLDALARVDDALGDVRSETSRRESREILDRLGVVSIPWLPVPA